MTVRSLARRSLLALVAAATLAWIGTSALSADKPAPAKTEKPAWPAHVQVIEARLLPPGKDFSLSLPQFRAYDPQGRQLFEQTGFQADDFERQTTAVLRGKQTPIQDAPALAAELAKIEKPTGGPLPPLSAADLTLVEYWADWCIPCHSQARELAKILAKHPQVKVNLVYVEAGFGATPLKEKQ